ncbi:hypothetical protein DVS77_08460 [Mycolicibacterium moriokaense]|nr:hypothetical protein DVS77_08460 [Mycolicibacterium moriokaense]
MNLTSRQRWEQIRRRWRVVAVLTVLTTLAATAYALTASATYTGKSTLMLSGRTPEQDAVMVVGYLTLFNDPATIARLKATNGIPEAVTAEALTAGASPILNIEATANDPKVAQDAAQKMAQTFSTDINATQQKGKDSRLADLENQLTGVNPLAPDGSVNTYYTELQTQIDQVKSDPTNELMVLQLRAGVNEKAPSTVFSIAAGLLGGLLLGVLAALGLAALSTRPANSADLRQRTGIRTLVDVPGAGDVVRDRLRRERLRMLANVVSLEGPPTPRVIAVADTRGGSEAREVAEALARSSAEQGSRTVLVYADNDPTPPAGGIGFNDALAKVGVVQTVLAGGNVELLKTMPAGSPLVDRYSLMTRERISAILEELRAAADNVIVATPPIADSAETPVLCAAADVAILAVTRNSSKYSDITAAADAVEKARGRLLGAVLIDQPGADHPGVPADDRSDGRFERFSSPQAGASSAEVIR